MYKRQEMFHKTLEFAEAGDNVGTLLRGIAKKDVERGQVLAAPKSIHPHTKFKGQVYVLSKDEGGRHTPFFNNYRPQFYFRTTDVTEMCIRDRTCTAAGWIFKYIFYDQRTGWTME